MACLLLGMPFRLSIQREFLSLGLSLGELVTEEKRKVEQLSS